MGLVGGRNPVATLGFVTLRGDDALEDAAVLLDGLDRSDVVIVTCNEDALQAKLLACNLERLPEESLWGISLAARIPRPRRSQCARQLARDMD